MSGEICPYCGAWSQRSCEWEEMTGNMPESAPCNFDDTWGKDPDRLREDRDERRKLDREGGAE